MQTVSCPSCGAPVQFRSFAAVMAVCGYCQATVVKDGDAVKDLGKMSAVLEDFSPIQIGTSGSYGGHSFSVVGRIQLRYGEGMWNEWFLLFDDGKVSWLGDSSGLYTITTERKTDGALPRFEEIAPGTNYAIAGGHYTASEIRRADCVGGQGELPFKVGAGWQAPVADFRAGPNFLTLDYSDGATPTVYTGLAVTLDELQCQLLRDDDTINASAGKFKGKVDALDCPSCGGSVRYLPGMTAHLICPSCKAQLDAAGPKAQVLAAGERVDAVRTTLALGAQASINGIQHEVIGLMQRADDENNYWTEYLLYNARSQFFWLVETEDGWWRANVMSDWPYWSSTESDKVVQGKVEYRKLYDYEARVAFAIGAFNWQVKVGDRVKVFEFEGGQARLAAELTDQEMTWSRSTRVAFDQLRAWFGSALPADAAPPARSIAAKTSATTIFMWVILGLNAIPLILSFSHTWVYTALAMLAIYLPAQFFGTGDKDGS